MNRHFFIDSQTFMEAIEAYTEENYPFKQQEPPSLPQVLRKINDQELTEYCRQAYPMPCPFIDFNTFLIYDLSDRDDIEENSLVFYLDGKIIKSTTTTSQIIHQFLDRHDMTYEMIKFFSQCLEIKQKFPVVIGDYYFAPSRGTTKQNAHWLALHHVIHLQEVDGGTIVIFRDHHTLDSSAGQAKFKKMKNNVIRWISLCECIEARMIQTYFRSRNPKKKLDPPSIIDLERTRYDVEFCAFTLYQDLITRMSHELLKGLLGEGSPYLEELEKLIQLKRDEIFKKLIKW